MKKLILLVIVATFLIVSTYGEAFVPTNKVIGYWSFDEGAGSTIYNVANRGTFDFNNWTGIPGFIRGKVGGWAISLNGSGDGDSLGNVSIDPTGIGNFTWSMWMNATQVASTQCILNHRDSGGNGEQDLCIRGGALTLRVGDGTSNVQVASAIVANRTYHVVAVANGSDKLYLYLNGTNIANSSAIGQAKGGLSPFTIGSNGAGGEFYDGWLDEVVYWNRSLGVADVAELYRNGLGKGFPTRQITPALISPSYQYSSSNASISFNFTGFSSANGFNMTNATLFLYNSTGLVNRTNISLTGNVSNNSRIIVNNLALENYVWNVYVCGINNTGTQCNTNLINYTLGIGAMVNTNTFNSTTYETARESFYSNISIVPGYTLSSASLYYDGTAYSATTTNIGGDDYSVSRAIDIPTGVQSNNWFWSLVFSNGFNQNLSVNSQSVSLINLSQYGSTPQNVAFLNFTFRDEDTNDLINATIDSISFTYGLGLLTTNKSLSLSNIQSQFNYGLAFSPKDKTVNIAGTVRYSNLTNYPQRVYSFDSTPYTNSTTLQTLYLLSSANGIYSSIQTSESTGATISGVQLTVERFINSEWVVVGQQTTGSDGLATFWVNPNYEHRITAIKSGYITTQQTITPSQSTYTLIMTRDSGSATYNGSLTGIVWKATPAVGPISPGTQTFNLNLTASLRNLDGSFCKMELVNAETSASLTSTTGGNAGGCNLSFSYNLVENVKYRAIYSIDLDSTDGFVIIDNDAYWFTINKNATNTLNIRSFFQDFKDLPEFGEGLRAEFSRTIVFFFILVCLLGILTFTTGYDFANPGWAMIIVLAPVAIASTVGFFEFSGLSTNDWVQKYSILMILIFMISGFVMSYVGRNT